jgi:succinate dehydrogenase/fumarate reductase cytochrome b subunit
MKKIFYASIIGFLSLLSTPALAQTVKPKDLKDVINNIFISGLMKPIIPFLIGLAVIVFIYGVLTLMLSEGGEKKEDGKKFMIWGIVGIFVMISVWGLVNILKETFNLDNTPQPIKIEIPKM